MDVTLSEQLVQAIGLDKLEDFDVTEDSLSWRRFVTIDLRRLYLPTDYTLVRCMNCGWAYTTKPEVAAQFPDMTDAELKQIMVSKLYINPKFLPPYYGGTTA